MRPKAFTGHFTFLAYPQGVLTSRLTIKSLLSARNRLGGYYTKK